MTKLVTRHLVQVEFAILGAGALRVCHQPLGREEKLGRVRLAEPASPPLSRHVTARELRVARVLLLCCLLPLNDSPPSHAWCVATVLLLCCYCVANAPSVNDSPPSHASCIASVLLLYCYCVATVLLLYCYCVATVLLVC